MLEFAKLLIRALYHIFRRLFSRTSETKISAPNPKREHYTSKLADSSRLHDSQKDVFYAGVRVPHRSEARFSIIFPGVLRGYERDYFLSKSWVNYFADDRLGTENPEKGLIIYWTDKAVGTKDLFATTCWKYMERLPPEVVEIHSDGEHLRCIVKGNSQLQRKIDQPKIKQVLVELSKNLKELPVVEAKRVGLNDRIPLVNFLVNGFVLFAFAGLLFLILPAVDYLDYEKAGDLLLCFALAIAAISIPFNWGKGFLNTLRISVLVSFGATLTTLALYQRIHYEFRSQGVEETWYVMSTKERFAKYTKQRTGYEISFFAKGKRWNKMFVPTKVLKGTLPQEKERVLFTIYTDLLGFHYIDSAKYSPDGNQSEAIELVN